MALADLSKPATSSIDSTVRFMCQAARPMLNDGMRCMARDISLMIAVAALVLGRDSEAPVGPSVAVTGYYWHFVDVVWVFVFATLYLLQ